MIQTERDYVKALEYVIEVSAISSSLLPGCFTSPEDPDKSRFSDISLKILLMRS